MSRASLEVATIQVGDFVAKDANDLLADVNLAGILIQGFFAGTTDNDPDYELLAKEIAQIDIVKDSECPPLKPVLESFGEVSLSFSGLRRIQIVPSIQNDRFKADISRAASATGTNLRAYAHFFGFCSFEMVRPQAITGAESLVRSVNVGTSKVKIQVDPGDLLIYPGLTRDGLQVPPTYYKRELRNNTVDKHNNQKHIYGIQYAFA